MIASSAVSLLKIVDNCLVGDRKQRKESPLVGVQKGPHSLLRVAVGTEKKDVCCTDSVVHTCVRYTAMYTSDNRSAQ
jgi:hypothetical protein